MTPNAAPAAPDPRWDLPEDASNTWRGIGLAVLVLAVGTLLFAGCYHKPVARATPKAAAPMTPVSVAAPVAMATPRVPPAAPPNVPSPTGWAQARRVRDIVGETVATRSTPMPLPSGRLRQADDLGDERAARVEAQELRELRKKDVGILVTTTARQELLAIAERRGLTVVDEQPLCVTFADDLRSGRVRYRMLLNDTGLQGVKAATMVWSGGMTWEMAEDDAVSMSDLDPTATPYPPVDEERRAKKASDPASAADLRS